MVAAQSVQRIGLKSHGLPYVDHVRDIGLVQEAQVNICLGRPAQRQLVATIMGILDVVGPETDKLHFFDCLPYPVTTS